MNKQELIDVVIKDKDSGLETKAAAERAVKAILAAVEAGIKKDGAVQLIGFGTFTVKKRAARQGRNPATGEAIKIKASTSVGFKAGAALKEVAGKFKPAKPAK